jgi:tRNA-dihydrouridine synthase
MIVFRNTNERGLLSVAKDDMSDNFYQRLNSPKHILAPMVAQSDLPFRLMCEQLYSVDLSYTQMIHAVNFVLPHGETFRTNHLDVYPSSSVKDVLLGNGDEGSLLVSTSQVNAREGLSSYDVEQSRKRILHAISERRGHALDSSINIQPTVVQIAAHDPDVALKAAYLILEMSGSMNALQNGEVCPVAAIDLNLGCPQSIARKGRYGSFLHDESPQLAYNVLTTLRLKLPPEIGVTAKIRLPPTQADAMAGRLGNVAGIDSMPQTIENRIQRLIDCGVDLITVHGRTRFENKVSVSSADWDSVQQCAALARAFSGDAHYPIISNGGIESWEDIQRCFDVTTASGVMSSESLLENPGLFCSEGRATGTARGLLERQLRYAEMYLDYATLFPPLSGSLGIKGGSFNVIRSHLFKFLHRYLEEHPDLRTSLGDHSINTIKQARNLVSDLRSRYELLNEMELRSMKSWDGESSWYRRHRHPNTQSASPSISIEERKLETRLRIHKMREERINSLRV